MITAQRSLVPQGIPRIGKDAARYWWSQRALCIVYDEASELNLAGAFEVYNHALLDAL